MLLPVAAGAIALALAPDAAAQCTQTSEAQAVHTAIGKAALCNQSRLTNASAVCAPAAPPVCAGTMVADAVALAYGPNNPPTGTVSASAMAPQLACQNEIAKAIRGYIANKLYLLTSGTAPAQAEATAAAAFNNVASACNVTVAQSASRVTLPAVGAQCAAAVGPVGSTVNGGALSSCLHTLHEVWVDRYGPAPAPLRPNIVMIVTDDQRWDTSGPTHSLSGATDVMAGTRAVLAGEGVEFQNAFMTTPLCAPSRASIFRGQYAHTTGVYLLGGPNGGATMDDTQTISVWLKSAGYRTGFFGKYINGYEYLWLAGQPPYVPPGWDEWHAFRFPGRYGYKLANNNTSVTYGSTDADYSTDVLRDLAKGFITTSANQGSPFFAMVSFYSPHLPMEPATRHAGLFSTLAPWGPPNFNEADISDKPNWLQKVQPLSAAALQDNANTRKAMLEMLLSVDEGIAGSTTYGITGIMQTIKSLGIDRDTIVVFMTDNGYAWGEHRIMGKTRAFEEHIRTPMFVRYPRLAPLARVEKGLAANIDVAPTFAELAGVTPPIPMDGRSFVKVLDGTEPAWRTDLMIEGYNAPDGSQYAGVREAGWKYNEFTWGDSELYDLTNDPYELTNVVSNPAHAARVAAMAARLHQIRPGWPNDVP
jgi:arylsulfatase A-like enzyme